MNRFIGKISLNHHVYEYDDLSNLTKETILEDSIKAIYYFENGKKTSMKLLSNDKLLLERLYNGEENLINVKIYSNPEQPEIIEYQYFLDKKMNWIRIIIKSNNKAPKEISRTIKYRD